MVDFHTHSNVSDGDFSPVLLIREAVKQGLTALALTDHDTLKGLNSANAEAKLQKTADGIPFKFISGIEININWSGLGPGGEFHLLGLGIHSPSRDFVTAIEGLSIRREKRNREILDRMNELSINVSWDDLLEMSESGNSLGRPHFAALLIKRKIVKNINQAFQRYLGVGKPLYVPKDGLNFEEAVALIRESGGIPVLAHPASLFISWGRLPDLINRLKNLGLMGLEAWHPTAKHGYCRRLEALAQSFGLYVTEGSDFHGSIRPDRRLGYSGKGRKINETVLEAIPELC